jgi:hypothetical protein
MSIHHRLTTLGFTPLADENETITHWCVVYNNGLLEFSQTITNDHATTVLTTPEAGENSLTTFWRLLGWHRVDNGFRRGSWFMWTDDAKKQFDTARVAAKAGE